MKVHYFNKFELLNLFLEDKNNEIVDVKIVASGGVHHYYAIEQENTSERFEK